MSQIYRTNNSMLSYMPVEWYYKIYSSLRSKTLRIQSNKKKKIGTVFEGIKDRVTKFLLEP